MADEGWVLWHKISLTKYSGDKLVEESVKWDIEGGYGTFEFCYAVINQKVDTSLQVVAKTKDQFQGIETQHVKLSNDTIMLMVVNKGTMPPFAQLSFTQYLCLPSSIDPRK